MYTPMSYEDIRKWADYKKIIDDLSEELCLCGKINRDIHYYLEELNIINGY